MQYHSFRPTHSHSNHGDAAGSLDTAKRDFRSAGQELMSGVRAGWTALQTKEGRREAEQRTRRTLKHWGGELEGEFHHDKKAFDAAMKTRREEAETSRRHPSYPEIQHSLAHFSPSSTLSHPRSYQAQRSGYGTYGGLGSSHPGHRLFGSGGGGAERAFKGMAGAGGRGKEGEDDEGNGFGKAEGGGGGRRQQAVYGRGY